MLSLQNNNYFPSLLSPIFHSKTRKHSETCFERGWGNSLKQIYVGRGGTCKINREGQGGGAQKLEVSSEHTF